MLFDMVINHMGYGDTATYNPFNNSQDFHDCEGECCIESLIAAGSICMHTAAAAPSCTSAECRSQQRSSQSASNSFPGHAWMPLLQPNTFKSSCVFLIEARRRQHNRSQYQPQGFLPLLLFPWQVVTAPTVTSALRAFSEVHVLHMLLSTASCLAYLTSTTPTQECFRS